MKVDDKKRLISQTLINIVNKRNIMDEAPKKKKRPLFAPLEKAGIKPTPLAIVRRTAVISLISILAIALNLFLGISSVMIINVILSRI